MWVCGCAEELEQERSSCRHQEKSAAETALPRKGRCDSASLSPNEAAVMETELSLSPKPELSERPGRGASEGVPAHRKVSAHVDAQELCHVFLKPENRSLDRNNPWPPSCLLPELALSRPGDHGPGVSSTLSETSMPIRRLTHNFTVKTENVSIPSPHLAGPALPHIP
ncbi:hypothetical protein AAFF_G00107220 [Aldrovandia affinis]|uniref:Uncharacterized protein n=1 Tax=Aldrovandia affinis TaxID=143900 RepID=A0AAD7T2R9_9TELE|nr:hypothetical protein AAFF_G00107220 [Aldrovandia affinis]